MSYASYLFIITCFLFIHQVLFKCLCMSASVLHMWLLLYILVHCCQYPVLHTVWISPGWGCTPSRSEWLIISHFAHLVVVCQSDHKYTCTHCVLLSVNSTNSFCTIFITYALLWNVSIPVYCFPQMIFLLSDILVQCVKIWDFLAIFARYL